MRPKVKKVTLLLISIAIMGCTNPVPNTTGPQLKKEDFSGLNKEYAFVTKELTRAYLERKLDKWLGLPCDVSASNIGSSSNCGNINGPGLVKEIAYARYKHPDTFCAIINEDPDHVLLDDINNVREVIDRRAIDLPFSNFIDGCTSYPDIIESRVNTYTTGIQYAPAVKFDQDGSFIIAWDSDGQDGDSYGLYARRYFSDGTLNGPEFRINSYTTGRQTNPSIAFDGNGDFVAAWQSTDLDGNAYGVFARRYYSGGEPTGNEFQVNSYTFSNQLNAKIAMDSSGEFVVTWHSNGQDNNGYGVYGQRYDSSGSRAGTEFQVNTYTTAYQYFQSVAMDADGDFVVVWQSFGQDGDHYGVYGQLYDSSGNPVVPSACSLPGCNPDTGEFRVNTYTTGAQSYPTVAMDSTGDFVVTWQSGSFSTNNQDGDGYGIYAQRYYSDGLPNGSEFKVNTFTAGSQGNAVAAMDSSGNFIISWNSYDGQDGDGYGIYLQRYYSDGLPNGSEFRANSLTTGNQYLHSIAMDAGGDFIATWASEGARDGDNYDIFAVRYNSLGEPL
jgi:hypothetical protein